MNGKNRHHIIASVIAALVMFAMIPMYVDTVFADDTTHSPSISKTSMVLGYNCEGSIEYWGFPCEGNHYYEVTSSNPNIIEVFETDVWYDGKYGYDESGRDVHVARFYACGYGVATITVSDGKYKKTCVVTVSTITKTDLPMAKITKPKGAKKSMTVKWKKISKKNQKKITKIQIQYSMDRNFKNGIKTVTAKKSVTSKKIKKLQSKKIYYVRIRAYKKSGGIEHVSRWSRVKKVKVR